jgi:hypothetical protein
MPENPYQSPKEVNAACPSERRFSFARLARLLCVALLVSAAILAGYKIVEILILGL